MQIIFSSFLVCVLYCALFSQNLLAREFVTGVRGNADNVQQLSDSLKIPILKKAPGEFVNGNTYVRLLESVAGSTVVLFLPSSLSSNDFMEALITIFALKKNHALDVRVSMDRVNTPTVTLADLGLTVDVERWLRAAGADSLLFRDFHFRPVKKFQLATRRGPGTETVVVGLHHTELAEQVAQHLGFNYVTDLNKRNISGRAVKLIAPSPEPVNASLFQTLLLAQKLRALGAADIELVTPYLPYARSDKVDQPGIGVNGRLIANLIEASSVATVSFVRPHAPQSEGFFGIPTKSISGRETINQYLRSIQIQSIIAPDVGFQKDAKLYADELSVPLAVINKKRNPITSEIEMIGISGPDVNEKDVAVIDDETASGGTLRDAAKYLKQLGARKVFAVVTHLTADAKAALNSPDIEMVVVTNTLPIRITHPKLMVLSAGEEIASVLRSYTPCEQFLDASR